MPAALRPGSRGAGVTWLPMMAVLSAVQTIRELSSVRGTAIATAVKSAATGAKPLPMTKYKAPLLEALISSVLAGLRDESHTSR
jgi:hypothetical protein